MSQQPDFPGLADAMKMGVTRREQFLAKMDAAVPWGRLLALIAPQYPKAGPTGDRRHNVLGGRMTSGSTLMRVAPVAELAGYVGRAILLEMPSGFRFSTITAAVAEGADHRLTLSSSLGEPVAIGTRAHFLSKRQGDPVG